MKTVILAGGYGTRISEESTIRPKPMVEIGGKPILWHIMKIYSAYGLNDFIICLGYKGHVIKEYFSNYFLYMSDVTYDLKNNRIEVHNNGVEPWKVTLVDTGEKTMTGGRIKRIKDYVGKETFCLTYGDGVSDINIRELIEFHRKQNSLSTLTAVQPPGRFGVIKINEEESRISSFKEKPDGDGAWINAGFFVMEPGVIDYISGDSTVWEQDPMQNLARDGAISAYRYSGFWHAMDNLRDKYELEELWKSGKAPWKVW
ncbi:glucose-1-phosphate cytidylyltransferase [Candidatus Kuenenia stuttgartiensis]|uniref:Strongly similar to glucose-1-phosphate cytidylyltransferase n=1 Tax=Kuenenia stuttgartiensis TaxID=174633 RepID=A0A2C9CBU9_KUEST|nr:glucose-1-phosphate cytidylyltransferase [Candidatus Kuenenia stuttgartiensis]SOH03053.1 strongly similar to glucose-1-phosphate cytidylyltransferase [Candidatus Kuenenia stuttgartiensis]